MEQTEYHRPFQSLLISHVSTALEEVQAGGSSQGILLIGGSGTGKTHAFDLIAASFERTLLDGQMLTPCVRIEMPLNPTPKNIVIAALKPLGGVYKSGGHSTPETQLRDAFNCHQVQVVLLEEFHNALLSGSTAVRNQVLKFVKDLWNCSPGNTSKDWTKFERRTEYRPLVIVISGTDQLEPAFHPQSELGSRFLCRIKANKFAFVPPESFKEFRYVLNALLSKHDLNQTIDPNDNNIASRLFLASGGHLRILNDLLSRYRLLLKRKPSLDDPIQRLAESFKLTKGDVDDKNNPFLWDELEYTKQINNSLNEVRRISREKA